MPDFFNNRTMEGAPGGWSEVFAALPMETPPAGAWDRITRALDAPASRRGAMQRERRLNWMIGLASAAVLAAVAWSPFSHWLQGGARSVRPSVVATEAPGLRGPAAPLRNEGIAAEPAVQPATTEIRVVSSGVSTPSPKPILRKPVRATRAVARQSRVEPTPVPASVASSTTVQIESAPLAAATAAVAVVDPLQKLKTQSAQLEALVALARDEHVANASSELLSSGLDSSIAVVDAALSQPDLSETRRQELWQQRVDLLQQLAGLEATSRWLAAQGASNDTALVSVY
jgi:hypothetical protein